MVSNRTLCRFDFIATGRSIRCRADSASNVAVPGLDPADELLVAVAGREQHGVLDGVRQPWVRLAHRDHAEDVPRRLHADRLARSCRRRSRSNIRRSAGGRGRWRSPRRGRRPLPGPSGRGRPSARPSQWPSPRPPSRRSRSCSAFMPVTDADEPGVGHVDERDLAPRARRRSAPRAPGAASRSRSRGSGRGRACRPSSPSRSGRSPSSGTARG